MPLINYYSASTMNGTVTASTTPNDGIAGNILVGTRTNDTFYGESGVNVYNEMHGLRGDDVFVGGSGSGTYNAYIGGSGVDKAVIAAYSGTIKLTVDYQGGLIITRPDGGTDDINSEVEIIQFAAGNYYYNISAGVDDSAAISNTFNWRSGDKLIISNDFLTAISSGNVAVSVRDVDRDGRNDTLLTGLNGVNSYVFSGYDLTQHPNAQVVGVYGQGVIFDLG